mgnify:CR=1 FL=1
MIARLRLVLGGGLLPAAFYLAMRLIWWLSFKARAEDPSKPKVTLVIPVYNVEKFLADALRSARAQNYANFCSRALLMPHDASVQQGFLQCGQCLVRQKA